MDKHSLKPDSDASGGVSGCPGVKKAVERLEGITISGSVLRPGV